MIEVIPFRAEHLDQIEVRPEMCKEELEWSRKHHMGLLFERFPSLTITDNLRIIACFGGVYLWPRTAESWLRTVSDVYKYKKFLVERVNCLTDFCFDIWNLNRVQTTVKKDWGQACRFVEHLGYIQEGEFPHYMGNTTYLMYSQIREK